MNAQTQHTPGPWEIVTGDEWTTDIGTPEGEYEDGRKRHWNIASVNKLRDEWEANRRLIAAAPEMLAVLQELEESAAYWSEYDVPLGIVDRIKAACAKARGDA